MAGKTNTDLIRELQDTVARLEERADSFRREVDRVEAAGVKSTELLNRVDTRLTVLEEKIAGWKRDQEERDKKSWQMWVAFAGSLLALVANVALLILRLVFRTPP